MLLIRWQTNALAGLQQLQQHGDVAGLIESEINRLQSPVLPPKDWSYLWLTGSAEAEALVWHIV